MILAQQPSRRVEFKCTPSKLRPCVGRLSSIEAVFSGMEIKKGRHAPVLFHGTLAPTATSDLADHASAVREMLLPERATRSSVETAIVPRQRRRLATPFRCR